MTQIPTSNTSTETAAPVLPYARPLDTRGKGPLSLAASLVLPGLGHWIAGDRRGGARWFALLIGLGAIFIACLSLPALVPLAPVVLAASAVLQIAQWTSAFRAGRRSRRRMLPNAGLRYLVALVLPIAAVVLRPALVAVWPVRKYIVEAFVTVTASMTPTLAPFDRFIVHKLVEPKRWDVVAIRVDDPRSPGSVYTKRLIGFPGETIEIVGGDVKVNGTLLARPPGPGPYTSSSSFGLQSSPIRLLSGEPGHGIEGHPITLGADEYYFLGDNSPISGDSRCWDWSVAGHQPGTLPRDHIVGVVTWRYWPIGRWGRVR